jgi:hypothetical protein
VKTRQVTYSVLNHLTDYVQNLEKVGLLEEKEMLHLHDAVQVSFSDVLLFTFILSSDCVSPYKKEIFTRNVASIPVQTDLKKLLRNPPLVKLPKARDLISRHPVFATVLSSVFAPHESSTKETMKLHGVTLYKEGSKPNGIWLISSGVVKVSTELSSDVL